MKKAVIIFLVLFVLSLAVPALACINTGTSGETRELVTLFNEGASGN